MQLMLSPDRSVSVECRADDDDALAAAAALARDDEPKGRTFQSLTVQSMELVRTRSLRSTGPRAEWKFRLMIGAVWPLYWRS